MVEFDVAPKENNDAVGGVEPKTGNEGIDVAVLSAAVVVVDVVPPNEGVAPKDGVGVIPLVDITEGANVFGGLLAPNVNGVLLDVVVVVLAAGKLKPDDEPLPNKGTDDVDGDEKLPGNENPLDVDAGIVNEEALVVDVPMTAGTVNKLGRTAKFDAVVVADNDDGAIARVEAPGTKENCDGLSDETVDEAAVRAVVAASGVLPNDPNVIVVGILIGDDDAVVVIAEGTIGVLIAAAVVVVVAAAEPNVGNVEDVLVLIWKRLAGVLVAVVVPNKGAAVEGNEILVVTGGLTVLDSLGTVDVAPNKGSVLVPANGAAPVAANGGIGKVLSLVVVSVVVTGTDSFGIVDGIVVVVTGADVLGCSAMISNVLVDDTAEVDVDVGVITRKYKQYTFNFMMVSKDVPLNRL